MAKTNEPTFIILHETVGESIVKDTYTFGCLIACTGIGWLLGITTLEVIGGIIFCLAFATRLISVTEKNKYTLAEAKIKLAEIEKELPGWNCGVPK